MHARESWLEQLRREVESRRAAHLLRELRAIQIPDGGGERAPAGAGAEVVIDGKTYLQFCTNNYLGLAADPQVIAAAQEATARWGAGAGASRLVAGSLAIHHELEAELARLKGAEAALLLPTGYMANLAVLTTLAREGDGIVSDKLNHASLLDAAGFSAVGPSGRRTFPHRNYARAGELLSRIEAGESGRRFLVTDGVFSMDGDVADLPAACNLADRADAMVILDDAHGTGVLGARGAGLAELQDVEGRIDVTVGTLSKALGSLGGFVAGPRVVIDTLINSARSFIFTTALPPACAAAALAALRIVKREPARRQRVLALADQVRHEFRRMGYNCGDSTTPIIPVMLGDSARALSAAAALRDRGLYIPAIRPPTVPPNSARLRISLMATHTDAQVERLITAMRELAPALLAPG